MPEPALRFSDGVTLAGGGALTAEELEAALALAPVLVAADGGADAAQALGVPPRAVIGDMDSVVDPAAHAARGARLIGLEEQETTDLEKCLYSVEAPFFIGVGFLGRRFDHSLAALHALMAYPDRRIVLLGEEDAAFLPPLEWRMEAFPGARISFLPLAETRALSSAGLEWPCDGLRFAMGARIGSSNRATAREVALRLDRRAMLAVVEKSLLRAALKSLVAPGVGEALTVTREAGPRY